MIGKRLKKGCTIGLISPSSPENPEKIKESIHTLKNYGFNIKEGNYLYEKRGYLAGEDKERAQDFMDMFEDRQVDMVLCMRGGYGSMRILPFIDYEIVKNNPKIFIGYSDITTLLNTLNSKCNLITFHGPMGNSNFNDSDTLGSFLTTLMNGYRPYKLLNPLGINLTRNIGGKASGKIVGGNLSLITATLGTPYEIDTKDNILFMEDINEQPYVIDRMLTQLHLSGKLKQCSGFIIGQFTGCSLPNYERSLTTNEVMLDRVLSLNKPTLSNFMCGHDYPNLTLPIGAKGEIDCDRGEINILEPVVK